MTNLDESSGSSINSEKNKPETVILKQIQSNLQKGEEGAPIVVKIEIENPKVNMKPPQTAGINYRR